MQAEEVDVMTAEDPFGVKWAHLPRRSSSHPFLGSIERFRGGNHRDAHSFSQFQNTALLLSSTAVLTAHDAFIGHRPLWFRCAQTLTDLYGLRAKLDYRTSGVEGLSAEETDHS
jgi:hypothetical protein